jgi:hypothetical protein
MIKFANSEEHLAIAKDNYVEWGKGLTLDQYLARERILQAVWMPKAVIFGNGLSSCEIYERTGLLVQPDGSVSTPTVLSIASVFTPPCHRRKGYATQMLKQVKSLVNLDQISLLYSDIGPQYYSSLGWTFVSAKTAVYDPKTLIHSISQCHLMTEPEALEFVYQDTVLLTEEMKGKSLLIQQPVFAMPLDKTALTWMFTRSKFYQETLGLSPLIYFGASLSVSDVAIWYHDFKECELIFLRFRAMNKTNAEALLASAAQEARRYALDRIVVWDPCPSLHSNIMDRTDSLPSMLSHELVHWQRIEKHGWV